MEGNETGTAIKSSHHAHHDPDQLPFLYIFTLSARLSTHPSFHLTQPTSSLPPHPTRTRFSSHSIPVRPRLAYIAFPIPNQLVFVCLLSPSCHLIEIIFFQLSFLPLLSHINHLRQCFPLVTGLSLAFLYIIISAPFSLSSFFQASLSIPYRPPFYTHSPIPPLPFSQGGRERARARTLFSLTLFLLRTPKALPISPFRFSTLFFPYLIGQSLPTLQSKSCCRLRHAEPDSPQLSRPT
jgi:hypothetical protein